MKLKKLWAGVTAAALAVGLVAVTPLFTSAANSSHVTGEPYIIAEAHGRYYSFSIREAKILSEGIGTYHFEATSGTYKDNFLEVTEKDDSGKDAVKAGEVGVHFYDCGATLSDYEATLTINDTVIATSTTAAANGSTWDYIAEANASTGGRKSIMLADKTDDIEILEGSKIEIDVTVKYLKAAPVGGTEWTKNADKSYSYKNVSKPDSLQTGDDEYGSNRLKPGSLTVPYSDYLTDDQKSLVREVKLTAEVGQWQATNGYVIITYLDEDNQEATTYVENAAANWSVDSKNTKSTVTFETPNGVTGDGFEVQTWYMNYDTSALINFEFVLAENVPVTGVTLNKTSLSLKEGDTATITATVAPENATDKTVTWTSSNTKVATVEDGVVTAVGAGTATITATAGTKTATAEVTVAADPVPVSAALSASKFTVYSKTPSAQASEVKSNLTVTIASEDGSVVVPSSAYTVDVSMTNAATEGADSEAVVTIRITDKAAYEMADVNMTVKVVFVAKESAIYQGIDIKTELSVEAESKDKVSDVILSAIREQTLTLKGADGYENWSYGAVGDNLTVTDLTENNDGTYTVTASINMGAIRLDDDVYLAEGKELTLGDSAEISTKTESVTFTVSVKLPNEPTPDKPTPDEPTPDKPTPDEPTPDKPTPDEPTPDKPTPDEPTPDKPTPDEPTPGTPSTPSTPAAVVSASSPRIGEGTVSTDINTGAAFTGTRAMEEVSRAKPGDSINIVMTGGMNEGEIIAKIAYKKNVTVNLKYSAYTVSINSDDVSEDFEAKGFYSTARFLSAKEKAAFAGAKELRQINVKNLDGIEKATITVTMRGGSKGMDATALNRISEGKYKTVETGKVAEDRTFSFEITKAGNYVVYAGKVDMD